MLTVINIKRYFPFISLTGKQGKPVRVFGFALACWEFPSPFSHFVWLRVSSKRWIAPKVIPSKIKKTRSQTPIKSASDSGHHFIVFLICWQVLFQKKAQPANSQNYFFWCSTRRCPMF